eukprot:TRINITY_DN69763_c0_g1_i1.p1 TRINITY_DN69763_c0_g1~~TRINITY_DN69763_c0_g1_i1.p1  ORF type:complete len:182 (+),score=24.34 TRINITY_DN69763_c0_g1_i1:155-700(+)
MESVWRSESAPSPNSAYTGRSLYTSSASDRLPSPLREQRRPPSVPRLDMAKAMAKRQDATGGVAAAKTVKHPSEGGPVTVLETAKLTAFLQPAPTGSQSWRSPDSDTFGCGDMSSSACAESWWPPMTPLFSWIKPFVCETEPNIAHVRRPDDESRDQWQQASTDEKISVTTYGHEKKLLVK